MTALYEATPCAECGGEVNLVWFTDSTLWNEVVRTSDAVERWGGEPILCIRCFAALVEERGYRPTGWRVLPEWSWKQES